MSMQGSRASAGYGRRRVRLLLRSLSPSHTQSPACLRWMSAQGGVQRSVPRHGSEARTGDDAGSPGLGITLCPPPTGRP
jgi:hypothetical protein